MMGYLLRNRVLFLGSQINDEVRHAWHLRRRRCLAAAVHPVVIAPETCCALTWLSPTVVLPRSPRRSWPACSRWRR